MSEQNKRYFPQSTGVRLISEQYDHAEHRSLYRPGAHHSNEGKSHRALSELVLYAVKFDNEEDPEQVEMNEIIAEKGLLYFLMEHSGLKRDVADEIINAL